MISPQLLSLSRLFASMNLFIVAGHDARTDIRAAWEPIFNSYGVDLVFQAHNHYYQRSNPINGTIYIVSGVGGTLYTPTSAWFVNNSKSAFHYCVLNISLTTMGVKMLTKYPNGSIFDEFVISKSSNVTTTSLLPIYVENSLSYDRTVPVTSGSPFEKGALTSISNLRLLDENLNEMPADFTAVATWKDGSIKWVLVDFRADLPPQW